MGLVKSCHVRPSVTWGSHVGEAAFQRRTVFHATCEPLVQGANRHIKTAKV